ncbi:hypothetical protein JD292_05335 [Leucobacter sp. CSA2]|uniref:DUF6993 domain-containing protein n=1 Tax=Leucobacter edaphi TaxID=2796472 RepID=A0A934QDZ2_9MICO|nr:hypothetical protein [Leucobacter edaphi]MBK0421494.1 hypothetical protein [Leucobacter edaphi]
MPDLPRTRRGIRATGAVSALILSMALLSGCALLEGPTPETPKRTEMPAPEKPAALVPGGSAADNLPFFTATLQEFSKGKQPVQAQPVSTALIDAGFDKSLMQVSFDKTKTNLDADNIFVSVRYGQDCLIGQVVTADRSVTTKNMPALGPNQDTCLIGNTNPITW